MPCRRDWNFPVAARLETSRGGATGSFHLPKLAFSKLGRVSPQVSRGLLPEAAAERPRIAEAAMRICPQCLTSAACTTECPQSL